MSCGGNCNCGTSCGCGSGCKMNPDLGSTETAADTKAIINGVGPLIKTDFEEMRSTEGGHGCRCGSNCTCDPCNC